jgi:hypothetical protein
MTAAETTHVPQRGYPDWRDFDGFSDEDLERELRELAIGAGIAPKDSAVRVAAVNRMQAIDKELARRAEERRE